MEKQAANEGAELPFLTVLETGVSFHWLIPARAARCQGISRRLWAATGAADWRMAREQGEAKRGVIGWCYALTACRCMPCWHRGKEAGRFVDRGLWWSAC